MQVEVTENGVATATVFMRHHNNVNHDCSILLLECWKIRVQRSLKRLEIEILAYN